MATLLYLTIEAQEVLTSEIDREYESDVSLDNRIRRFHSSIRSSSSLSGKFTNTPIPFF